MKEEINVNAENHIKYCISKIKKGLEYCFISEKYNISKDDLESYLKKYQLTIVKEIKKRLELEGYYVRVYLYVYSENYSIEVFKKETSESKYLEDLPGMSSGIFGYWKRRKFRKDKYKDIDENFWYTDYKPSLDLDKVLLNGSQKDMNNLRSQMVEEYLKSRDL